MKKLLLLFLAPIILMGCEAKDDALDPNVINIRLRNVSEYTYTNIVVNTSTGDVSYQDLAPGESSIYASFTLAYRYAFVELEIDGETFTIQPIDYVGEEPLSNGAWTYVIDADDSNDQFTRLSLTLEQG